MEQRIILNRLLEKYENSMHLLHPGASNRRVMLTTQKKEMPEYRYEEAETRDRFNKAAEELERRGVVLVERVPMKPLIERIILSMDMLDQAYSLSGRDNPARLVERFMKMIDEGLAWVRVPWIRQWGESTCDQMRRTLKLSPFCRQGEAFFQDLLKVLREYDAMAGESVTMRAFSAACFRDTKRFEREFKDSFLRIAGMYNQEFADIGAQQDLSWRDQLAFLGIYTRPELYELAGSFSIKTPRGQTDFSAFSTSGVALPSTCVESIISFDLSGIKKITFIENKTNYDEYIVGEKEREELVAYHGGFLSPQKRKLIKKIAESVRSDMKIFFWGDIDMGGFQMFAHMCALIPSIVPMRMSERDVDRFAQAGLPRRTEYLDKLKLLQFNGEFADFREAIKRILHYGVTIEQEVFLISGAGQEMPFPSPEPPIDAIDK